MLEAVSGPACCAHWGLWALSIPVPSAPVLRSWPPLCPRCCHGSVEAGRDTQLPWQRGQQPVWHWGSSRECVPTARRSGEERDAGGWWLRPLPGRKPEGGSGCRCCRAAQQRVGGAWERGGAGTGAAGELGGGEAGQGATSPCSRTRGWGHPLCESGVPGAGGCLGQGALGPAQPLLAAGCARPPAGSGCSTFRVWGLGAGAPSPPKWSWARSKLCSRREKVPACLPFYPGAVAVSAPGLGVKRGGVGGCLPRRCWPCPPWFAQGLWAVLA